jgi:hypothetical protein
MFPPWAPFFVVLAAGRLTAARSKLRSAKGMAGCVRLEEAGGEAGKEIGGVADL